MNNNGSKILNAILIIVILVGAVAWFLTSRTASPAPSTGPTPTPSVVPNNPSATAPVVENTKVPENTLAPATDTPAPTPIPATATPALCTEDQVKYWNGYSFEIWPAGSNPGKAHWESWPDGTLIIIQGNAPKGDLPYGVAYNEQTKTYSVNLDTLYIVEWWNVNTEKEEGIFSVSGAFDPTLYNSPTQVIVFHAWTGITPASCRYDSDRAVAFNDIPVYPDGNTLKEVRAAGVPDYAHLMQYLLKNESLGDMECRPALVNK